VDRLSLLIDCDYAVVLSYATFIQKKASFV
jgi:hypothetical protein